MRQYIGARYVPKFMGTYNNTQEYEALSVVDNGMGTSYITKIPTPAGTPLTDTTYYAIYGASSGAIINLQNQIGDLADLDTTDKDNLVDAINEIANKIIVVTPEMFGAVGDGVTDDTQALTDALASSKIIELTNGASYKISNVTIPANTTINGNGATIIATANNCMTLNDDVTLNDIVFTDNMLTLNQGQDYIVGASDKTKIHIEHCHFNNVHIADCIRFSHCDNCTIEHNVIEHYSYAAIMLAHTCSYMKVNFNKVYDGRGSFANRYPISISGYSDNADYGTAHHIECCYNDIEDLTPVWEGIDSHGVNDCHVAFNNIKNTVDGIIFTSPSGGFSIPTNVNNVVIENNVIDVIKCGIGINANESGNVSKNVIVRNNDVKCTNIDAVQAITRAGIFALFYELNGLLIENNTVNSNKHGITVQHFGGTNIKVNNNKITSGNTSGNYGLWLDFHTSYNQTVVDNNDFVDGDKYFRGPSVTGGSNSLIKIVNARFATTKADNIDYTDFKRGTAPSSDTRAVGSNGDYIPCVDASGGIAGWYCVNPSRWFEINLGNELS